MERKIDFRQAVSKSPSVNVMDLDSANPPPLDHFLTLALEPALETSLQAQKKQPIIVD